MGLLRELKPGPLVPEARIMPLDQAAKCSQTHTHTQADIDVGRAKIPPSLLRLPLLRRRAIVIRRIPTQHPRSQARNEQQHVLNGETFKRSSNNSTMNLFSQDQYNLCCEGPGRCEAIVGVNVASDAWK